MNRIDLSITNGLWYCLKLLTLVKVSIRNRMGLIVHSRVGIRDVVQVITKSLQHVGCMLNENND